MLSYTRTVQTIDAHTGGEPLPGTASDFARLMAAETEKWGKVVKAAGIKAN